MHCLSCDPSLIHHLTFQLSSELEASKPPIPISKTMIDQVYNMILLIRIDVVVYFLQ